MVQWCSSGDGGHEKKRSREAGRNFELDKIEALYKKPKGAEQDSRLSVSAVSSEVAVFLRRHVRG